MISVKLYVVGGKHSGQVIPLNRKKFLIGREQDCQLRPNSELVSRHHCIFTVDEFSVRVRDLGSTNGTLVNGARIRKEVVLQPNDRVLVGNLEFDIHIDEISSAGDTTRVAAQADETVVSGTETLPEIDPVVAPPAPAPAEQPAANVGGETMAIQTPPPEAPVQPATPMTPPEMPMPGVGDTTVIAAPPGAVPGQTPYQPVMPPMGYPQQPVYGGFPYPGMPQQPMPGFPQPGFPGAMPPGYGQYPQQHMPPAQQPMPAQPPAGQPAAPAPAGTGAPEVSLPDPANTGAKTEPPKPANPEANAESKEEPSNMSAAAIIQQHMQRRPGG